MDRAKRARRRTSRRNEEQSLHTSEVKVDSKQRGHAETGKRLARHRHGEAEVARESNSDPISLECCREREEF